MHRKCFASDASGECGSACIHTSCNMCVLYREKQVKHAFLEQFLTHCGLVTPFGDIDLGQHWFG